MKFLRTLCTVLLVAVLACSTLLAGTLTFKDFVGSYLNKPGVTVDNIVTATGAAKQTVVDYITYAQRKNYEHVIANAGEAITADELLAAWDKDHPPTVCKQTPFGVYCIPQGEKLAGELTVAEFEALLAKHCGK